VEDRRSRHPFDPRSTIGCPSIFCSRPGYASLPACSLGERRIDWKRCALEPYCLLLAIITRKHPRPDPSALSPPNALLSETARWKRCAPSFIPTAPQKRDGRSPQSLILPKPVNATILPAVMRLGIIINLLIWVGLSASPYLWPGTAPVQASASERSVAQSAQESNSLELGKPIQRELSSGQTHYYKITMVSGQYLHVVVDQRGIDVAVALFTPDGKKISEVDGEHLIEGSETVSA